MTEFTERQVLNRTHRKGGASAFRPAFVIVAPIVATLFQFYVPYFFPSLKFLEFPLLIDVYFALTKRKPIAGLFFGAAVGLMQDCLTSNYIGMYGIVKTLVGYFAASVPLNTESQAVRVILGFFFFLFHQFFYWVLARSLVGQQLQFSFEQNVIFGLLNAAVALPLFYVLDKLRE